MRQGDYEANIHTAAECAACCHVPKVHGSCSRAKMRCEETEEEALNEQSLFGTQHQNLVLPSNPPPTEPPILQHRLNCVKISYKDLFF